MTKMIAFREDAREAIRRGVGELTKAVRSILGPCAFGSVDRNRLENAST